MIVKNVKTKCTHCDLPVPMGLVVPDASEQFCCSGCRVAYQLIHENGLDAFYQMADRSPLMSFARQEDTSEFAEYDQDSFLQKFAHTVSDDQMETSLLLDGIHCAACIWLIEKLPQILPGVNEVTLNWAKQTAKISWQPDAVPLSRIASTLSQLGYYPHPIRQSENETRRRKENRRHLIRIGIAGAAAGNNMLIAVAIYLGMFSQMGAAMLTMLRVASCVIGLASLLGPGRIFLRGAWIAIRTRTPHMDLPIALGLLVGSIAGLVNTVLGIGDIYFDSLTVLIFVLLVGRWIQFRQQNRAADSVEMLYRLTPKRARKLIEGRAIDTFLDMIEIDDLLEVRAGDLLPVDGIIVDGQSEVDESILSGESRPVLKNPGDEVLAGTKNRTSRITVRTTQTERGTRLSRLVDLVEQASSEKPEIVQWANRIGGYFVAVVLFVAMVTLATWIWTDAGVAIDRTVALLIVACPCALAIATPLAISVALGRAAKRRIMIKGGNVLQMLTQPGLIWLDKTGTLTEGRMEVVQWRGDRQWASAVHQLELNSTHPVGKALVEYLESSEPSTEVESVETHEGMGMSGSVKGQQILVGNRALLNQHGVSLDSQWQSVADDILKDHLAPCWIAVGGTIQAVAAVGDHIRSDAQESIAVLKAQGWKVGVLSGDHQEIVDQVSRRLGIQPDMANGELSPEEKVKRVQLSLQEHDTVVMVGDGVNDSAALAAASVGIAVHGGAEASLAAAPVYLAEAGLSPILQLLAISKSTANTMRVNLGVSLTYNLAGATLAFLGFINPLVAAILMPLSSISVVALSMTAGRSSVAPNNSPNPETS